MIPYLLPQAIEAACARWPERVAITAASGAQLSYATLERRSRALAARLQAGGCGRGGRVGVWMAKSSAAVVALFAVLRAGAVYVPLDPWAPSARIESLAADCALSLLLCDPAGAEAAARWACPPPHIWSMEDAAAGADASPILPWRPPAATADDVAYILYTSGSTGVPKGVMLTHAHALNFIRWAGAEVGLRPGDCVASHAPFHFDLSIFDLWASLSHGATVCLLDPVSARFPRAVADWVLERGITVWYSVPSALVSLLPYAPQLATTLRVVAFAGEVFPPPALRTWREAAPAASFHNWYGPTETNVCTHFRLPPLERAAAPVLDPLPIGRACPNFDVELADEDGVPTAPGAAGFLWVRGPGILAGYWGGPARTPAVTRMRSGPGGQPQRWYNTGDLVRRDPAGDLIFLGRRDHLIKHRGYRISLLEIEAALETCPRVLRAAVVAAPGASQPSVLTAFVVPAGGARLGDDELCAWLRQRLPAYMLPDAFQVCSQLPETATGKVDRTRLLAAASGRLQRAATPPS